MPDYIQHNGIDGTIINKWVSIDFNEVEGKSNIIQIDRTTYHALTKYHKVENDQVVEMTQIQKDALDDAEALAKVNAENARIAGLDGLIKSGELAGITMTKVDGIIDNINNLTDAKSFFKKLCRYIVKYIARNR